MKLRSKKLLAVFLSIVLSLQCYLYLSAAEEPLEQPYIENSQSNGIETSNNMKESDNSTTSQKNEDTEDIITERTDNDIKVNLKDTLYSTTTNQTTSIEPKHVKLINKADGMGSVTVTGFLANTTITVYIGICKDGEYIKNGEAIGQITTGGKGNTYETDIRIPDEGCIVLLTAKAPGLDPSPYTAFEVEGLSISSKLDTSRITIVNNAGYSKDTIAFTEIQGKTEVRIWEGDGYGLPIGDRAVRITPTGSYGNSVAIPINLNDNGGELIIYLRESGKAQSEPVVYQYAGLKQAISLTTSNIIINKLQNGKGTISIVNYMGNASISVFNALEEDNNPLVTFQTGSKGNSLTFTIDMSDTGGMLRLTATAPDCSESEPYYYSYDAMAFSRTVKDNQITITNKSGTKNDQIFIAGIGSYTAVRIYMGDGNGNKVSTTPIAEGSAGPMGNYQSNLGLDDSGGQLFIALQEVGKVEGAAYAYTFKELTQTARLTTSQVVLKNNTNGNSTLSLINYLANTTINVYKATLEEDGVYVKKGNPIATFPTGGKGNTVAISINTPKSTEHIILTAIAPDCSESEAYCLQCGTASSITIKPNQITFTNKSGYSKDSIYLSNIGTGTVVKIYSGNGSGEKGSSTAICTGSAGTYGNFQGTINLNDQGGELIITLQERGKPIGQEAAVKYSGLIPANELTTSNLVINKLQNGKGTAKIINYMAKASVKMYEADLINETYVKKGNAIATFITGSAGNSVEENITMPDKGGHFILIATAPDCSESEPYYYSYRSMASSVMIRDSQIQITNKSGLTGDSIYISNVGTSTAIKIYKGDGQGNIVGTIHRSGSAGLYGNFQTQLDLNDEGGEIIITLQEAGKTIGLPYTYSYAGLTPAKPLTDINILAKKLPNGTGTIAIATYLANATVKVYPAIKSGDNYLRGEPLLATLITGSKGNSNAVTIDMDDSGGQLILVATAPNYSQSSEFVFTYTAFLN